MPLSTCAITDYFAAQQVTLQEGQIAEAGLEACDWITEIAHRLGRGFVLTIDYGHEAADLFDDHHMAGTLLSYAQHQASDNPFVAPGEQDLTAHVNFTALRQWGARQGLETLGLVSQTAFLLALGKGNDFADLYDEGMNEIERTRARLQLKTLIYPEGMGERFQVLVQQKGVATAGLTCFHALSAGHGLADRCASTDLASSTSACRRTLAPRYPLACPSPALRVRLYRPAPLPVCRPPNTVS